MAPTRLRTIFHRNDRAAMRNTISGPSAKNDACSTRRTAAPDAPAAANAVKSCSPTIAAAIRLSACSLSARRTQSVYRRRCGSCRPGNNW